MIYKTMGFVKDDIQNDESDKIVWMTLNRKNVEN